jgi:hypothetical protein
MNWTVEQQIIAATDAVYMRFGKWSFPDLEAGFQAVERQFAGVLEEADYLEVKRRVAEGTLAAAQDTEQPVRVTGAYRKIGMEYFLCEAKCTIPIRPLLSRSWPQGRGTSFLGSPYS